MFFAGTIYHRENAPDSRSVPTLPQSSQIPVDIWAQAETDRITDHARAPRVRVRFAANLMGAEEKVPPLPPMGRYMYPHLDYPLLNAYLALMGKGAMQEPTILISERLRHAPTHLLHALISHEIGHHLTVHDIIDRSRSFRHRNNLVTIGLISLFAATAALHLLNQGQPLLATLAAAFLVTAVFWILVIAPREAELFHERQRQHWEYLADRHGQRIHGPSYYDDLDQLRQRYLTLDEYQLALILDRAESHHIRQARNQSVCMRLWRLWRAIRHKIGRKTKTLLPTS